MEIEAKIVFTEALLLRGHKFQKDSFKWLSVLVGVGLFCQILGQFDKFSPLALAFMLGLAGFILFVLPRFRDAKIRNSFSMHPWIGREVAYRFRPGYVELQAPGRHVQIEMKAITRVSSDERGILAIVPKFGALWIPVEAFNSSEEKKAAFEMLRESLRKKR